MLIVFGILELLYQLFGGIGKLKLNDAVEYPGC